MSKLKINRKITNTEKGTINIWKKIPTQTILNTKFM